MTLARQQLLFFAVAIALLIAVAAALLANQRRVGQALDDLSRSQSIISTVLMMRIIAGEVTISRTDRHPIQWQTGMRVLANVLDSVRTESAAERIVLQTMKQNVSDADALFHRFETIVTPHQARFLGNRQTDILGHRINDALQLALGNVNLNALRLSELEATEVRVARRQVLWTSFFLVLAALAILQAYLVFFRRSVLAPIKQLQSATDRIAAGDLEHRVGLGPANEFGELGRRFDRMAGQLQASQARQQVAIKELDAFAYSVSHDLRAPLRGMDAFSQILQSKYAAHMDEDALHCLQMIRDNAKQMGRLIDDLLAFSRLSQQPLRKERVDQEALVHAVLQSLQAERKGRHIDVTIGALPAADADPRLLRQVWVNLIANALKFSKGRDTAVIHIDAETQDGAPVYYVQDNGVGFDMRYAHKLFGVFQRLHRAEDYEGTGVGLAIVQRIVARHGGRIWTLAAKNQGATFYFTLQGVQDRA
jgi:signal transduction histidine kinase